MGAVISDLTGGMQSFHIFIFLFLAVFLSFNGENIATNGFIFISSLNTNDTALICMTDSVDCCNESIDGGWFGPNGAPISFDPGSPQGFYSSGGSQEVRLIRGEGFLVEGIYTCRVPDNSSERKIVYVGLYNITGGKTIQRY